MGLLSPTKQCVFLYLCFYLEGRRSDLLPFVVVLIGEMLVLGCVAG